MKRMRRWLGIMMSVILAAGSLQVNVYSAETAEIVIETEDEGDEITDFTESEEPETELASEGAEEEEESSAEGASEILDESFFENDDTAENFRDYAEDCERDLSDAEDNEQDINEVDASEEPADRDRISTEDIEEAAGESETTEASMSVVESGTCGDNLTWSLDEEGTLTISGTGEMYDFVNSEHERFNNNTVIKAIIDYGVTNIGDYAFYGCYNLTNVTIPDSVTGIGNSAFRECSSLTSVTIPSSVTSIGNRVFNNCNSLISVTIPDSVTSIGSEAFAGCSSLTSVIIPINVTSIGDNTFRGCSSLTNVTIPDSVTSIGSASFKGCSSLTSMSIPSGVTSIGRGAFGECSSLNNIVVESGNTSYSSDNGVLFDKDRTEIVSYPGAREGAYSIPESVTRIGESAFYGCGSLTSVTIPNSVTSIERDAFSGCSGLTSVTIPNSVTGIARAAFYGCGSLTSVTIPNSVTGIGNGAFQDCSSLAGVTIPDSVTSIGETAFSGCGSLTSVTIPISVTSIGRAAFSDCSSLTSIYFKGKAPAIEPYAFKEALATAYYPIYPYYGSSWTSEVKQDYGGTITWTGKAVDLSDCTISISPASCTYDGIAKEPSVTISYGDSELAIDMNYTLSYSSNTDAGTGIVTATARRYFTGTVSETFTISKAAPTLSFTSTNITKKTTDSAFINTLTMTTDGTVTFSSDDTSVAAVNGTTGEVTIKSTGRATITAAAAEGKNYTAGTAEYTLLVLPYDISECTVTIQEENYIYTGKAAEPPLTVKRGTATLIPGTDYMVEYNDNINAGTAAITIAGIGKYTGTVRKTFTIRKAPTVLSFSSDSISKKTTDGAFTNKLTKTTDGTATFKSSSTAVATVNETTGEVTIKGAGTARITVTVAEGMNYTDGSAFYTLTVTDASVLTLESLTYSFANKAESFGYPKDYMIPLSAYQAIFGNTTKASWYYKTQSAWGGNCMGFSSTSALMHDPDSGIEPSGFNAGAERISNLGVRDENTSIGMTVTQFIEAMQISQKTQKVKDVIASNRVYTSDIKAGSADLNSLYNTVREQTKAEVPVIIAVYQNGGHAILAYKAEETGSTESRIYVYDNNYPSTERYITLTKNSSGDYTAWTYDMGGHGIWGTSNKSSSISYIPYSVISFVWEHRGDVNEIQNVVRFNSRNIALYDANNKLAATVIGGELVSNNKQIRIIEDDLEAGGSSNDGYTLLSMPIDVYTVRNLDSNTEELDLAVIDTNLGASVETTAREVAFVVDDSNDLNSIMIHAEEDDSYSIELNSSFDHGHDMEIKGYGSGETMEVSQENGYISINNCQIMNITVDGVEVSKYSISASAGEGGSISPSGESTVIRDMDQSYTITPDRGYAIEDVKVDGKSVGAVKSYTFNKVRAAHTISATFKKSVTLPGKTTRGDMFNLANNVKVTWKEVSGAKYYKVYREGITDPRETRKDPVIVTTGLVGWDKDPGLTNGHAYRYKIVASLTGKGDSSGDSKHSYAKVMYRLKTVVIRSVKNTAPGKVTVKYDKTTAGDSYVLQYSENRDMTGAKTKVVLGADNTSYVIGGLKKGKTYYISIRVRKKVDGIDYYTTFGVPKEVTVTK